MVEALVESGAKLIEKLDSAEIGPSTAYWELDDDNVWKLKLYSPQYFKIGSKAIYSKILDFISQGELNLELSDVSIVDPFDSVRRSINMMIGTGDSINTIRLTNNRVNGLLIKDIVLYRSNSQA